MAPVDVEYGSDLERRYREWLATPAGQKVFALFERFALQMLDHGRRFGIALIAERVRWEIRTTWAVDESGWKINNSWRAYLSRSLIERYPGLAALIETRRVHGAHAANDTR